MSRLTVAALSAGLALSTVAGPAVAGPPTSGPYGLGCGLVAVLNPTAEDDVMFGVLFGGPLVVTDANGDPASGTLTCTVQVGTNDTHVEADAAPPAVGTGTGAVVAGPQLVSYVATEGQNVSLCTKFRYDTGRVVYRHPTNDPTVAGHWTTDSSKQCELAITVSSGPAVEPLSPVKALGDAVLCPLLPVLFPPDGDIPGGWDCPPYRYDGALVETRVHAVIPEVIAP